jgi:uncharacterized protein
MSTFRLLMAAPPVEQTVARLGLIADTHMPERLRSIPDAVFHVFAGVDLILHAGDVGELVVLETLSSIAPVVAVHGNDESAAAQRELPYQRLLTIGGLRLLLTHAHYPDRAEELASRRSDAWEPKLERRATMGREAGAQVVIYGHTHVPQVQQWGDLLLVNPGALASGNYLSRQVLCSVALLSIDQQGGIFVEHRDLAAPDQSWMPVVNLAAGFRTALDAVSANIASAEVMALWPSLRALFEPGTTTEAEQQALHQVFSSLALPRWIGELATPITRTELVQAMQHGLDQAFWQRFVKPILIT